MTAVLPFLAALLAASAVMTVLAPRWSRRASPTRTASVQPSSPTAMTLWGKWNLWWLRLLHNAGVTLPAGLCRIPGYIVIAAAGTGSALLANLPSVDTPAGGFIICTSLIAAVLFALRDKARKRRTRYRHQLDQFLTTIDLHVDAGAPPLNAVYTAYLELGDGQLRGDLAEFIERAMNSTGGLNGALEYLLGSAPNTDLMVFALTVQAAHTTGDSMGTSLDVLEKGIGNRAQISEVGAKGTSSTRMLMRLFMWIAPVFSIGGVLFYGRLNEDAGNPWTSNGLIYLAAQYLVAAGWVGSVWWMWHYESLLEARNA